jgi:hypothetical protein
MQFSDIVIIILLSSSILIWTIFTITSSPRIAISPPQIIYRFRPDLDLQFDSTNFPSTVYSDMFNGNNIWQGGYSLDSNKSTLQQQLNPVSNQNLTGGTIAPVPIKTM